tara:strand:+ start:1313 stop:1582 length:270 start_codon:yes stop_codon:yes gene_type:complete
MEYDNELRGVLFVNDNKNPKDPDCKLPHLTGHIEIKGVKYSLSAWTRGYEKDGEQKKLVSLKATHPDDIKKFSKKEQNIPTKADDGIPF